MGDYYVTVPVEKDVRLFRENGQLVTQYKYRYSEYRMFNIGTVIKFPEIEEYLDELEDTQ
jgi:hypothetical protein